MFGWLFSSKPRTKVDDIIQLMENRPLEWTFSDRQKIDYSSYEQTLSHGDTQLSLVLKYSHDTQKIPTNIKFDYAGHVDLDGEERDSLIAAAEKLRHTRFNAIATQYLKLCVKLNCTVCKQKIHGWSWVCKCQAILDQDCYGKANVCPECGGTLVSAK